jgi:hypothetical protein
MEDLGHDGRIILQWIFQEVGLAGMAWIALAQDRDRCQALVNAVMNVWVP